MRLRRQRDKVSGIYASRVRALMMHVEASRYIADARPVHDPIGFLATKDWAKVLIMVASPGPTLRCPFHYNEPEEPLVSFVGV
jgi:hypothetical protein